MEDRYNWHRIQTIFIKQYTRVAYYLAGQLLIRIFLSIKDPVFKVTSNKSHDRVSTKNPTALNQGEELI